MDTNYSSISTSSLQTRQAERFMCWGAVNKGICGNLLRKNKLWQSVLPRLTWEDTGQQQGQSVLHLLKHQVFFLPFLGSLFQNLKKYFRQKAVACWAWHQLRLGQQHGCLTTWKHLWPVLSISWGRNGLRSMLQRNTTSTPPASTRNTADAQQIFIQSNYCWNTKGIGDGCFPGPMLYSRRQNYCVSCSSGTLV